MLEAQGPCMEALAVLAQFRFFVAVNGVAQNGVTDVGHVHPNLVGAPGFQPAANVGIAPIAAYHFPVGHGRFGIALGDAHFFAVRRVAANGGVHRSGIFPEGANHNGFIGAGHGVVFQLASQHGVGVVILGHRQQAGGVLVNPVDNAGAQFPVDAAQVVAQGVKQAVNQGIVAVACGRMDHQPFGLLMTSRSSSS